MQEGKKKLALKDRPEKQLDARCVKDLENRPVEECDNQKLCLVKLFPKHIPKEFASKRYNRYRLACVHENKLLALALVTKEKEKLRMKDIVDTYLSLAAMIIQRRNDKVQLQNSEEFLNNIFNSIQDGISVLDKDYRIMRVNHWMEKNYADRMPLVGKKCHEAYQQKKNLCPLCPSKIAMKTGKKTTNIVPYPNETDPQGWIELSAYPLKGQKGEVTGIIEYVKDITELKKAEQAINESEERYDIIINSTGQLIYDTKVMTGKTVWSGAVKEVTGHTPEEFTPDFKGWQSRIHPLDRRKISLQLDKAIQGSCKYTLEYRFKQKDGSYKYISDTGFYLKDDKKNVHRMLGAMSDISERKKSEEILKKKNAELERFNKMALGRELKMIELKKRIRELEKR